MTLVFEQVLSSELSRNPLSVFSAAEKAPIRISRRDGQDLVLMTEREFNRRQELFDLACLFLGAALADGATPVERLADRIDWMYALDPVDRAQCADELFAAARASLALGEPKVVVDLLTKWRETTLKSIND